MICLVHGYMKKRVTWDQNKIITYIDAYDSVQGLKQTLFLEVDGLYYVLDDEKQIELACMIASDYHNNTFYNHVQDDGWNEHTRLLELQAEEAMLERASDEDSDPLLDVEYVMLEEKEDTKRCKTHEKKS